MKSFRLEGGDELTVWGWLLLVATGFIELGVITVAVELGLQNLLGDFRASTAVFVGVAICVFLAGGFFLESVGLPVMKESVNTTKGSGPTDFQSRIAAYLAQLMKALQFVGKGLLAGATLCAVGTFFHMVTPLLVPSIGRAYQANPLVFRPWPGWTRTYMIIHPFVYGFIFAWAYGVVRDASKDGVGHGTAGGAAYGLLVFLVGCLPVYLLNYASIWVPAIITISWITSGLVQYVSAGALLGCVTDGALFRVGVAMRMRWAGEPKSATPEL